MHLEPINFSAYRNRTCQHKTRTDAGSICWQPQFMSSQIPSGTQELARCSVGCVCPQVPTPLAQGSFLVLGCLLLRVCLETCYMDFQGMMGKPLSNGRISAVGPCSFSVPKACPAPGGYGRLSIGLGTVGTLLTPDGAVFIAKPELLRIPDVQFYHLPLGQHCWTIPCLPAFPTAMDLPRSRLTILSLTALSI